MTTKEIQDKYAELYEARLLIDDRKAKLKIAKESIAELEEALEIARLNHAILYNAISAQYGKLKVIEGSKQ